MKLKKYVIMVDHRYIDTWFIKVGSAAIINTKQNIYLCSVKAGSKKSAITKASKNKGLPEHILLAYEQIQVFIGLERGGQS
jgi:hypothetical protein